MDNFTGTAANDLFDASRAVLQGQVLNSLGNSDVINGGEGTDTLNIQLSEALDVTPTIRNVETLSVEQMNAAARIINMINGDASVKTVSIANSVNDISITNLQGKVDTVNLSNNNTAGVDATVTMAAGLTGTTDVLALNLSNVTAGTVTVGSAAAGSGYETINVASNGTIANVLTSLTDGLSTSLTTVNVTGSQAITLPLADATVTTVDASALTGVLTLTVAAGNTQNMTITGGTANDVINMNGTYTANDTINGGDGTDRLVLTNAEAIAATTAQTRVTNIETIGLSNGLNGTVTVSNFGATGLNFGANLAGAGIINYAAGTSNLNVSTFNNNTVTVNIAGVATNDVLNYTIGNATAGTGNAGSAHAITINGAETVNLSSVGAANTFGAGFTITDTAANQALVITGNQDITFTGAVRADSVDASGMTGTAALSMAAGTGTTATTITGTANNDTLAGSTAGDIISGGAGNDTIRNAVSGANNAANDILTGGAGNDSFQLVGASAGTATNYNGSSFITDFTVGTTTASTDFLVLDITTTTYGASDIVTAPSTSIVATVAGSVVVQNVAQNAAAAAGVTGAGVIKLTTGVTFTTDIQGTFNAAIGSATVTGYTAADDVFVTFYDTTNGRAVIALADVGVDGTLATADTVTLIGTIAMTAADYATFNGNNIAFVDF